MSPLHSNKPKQGLNIVKIIFVIIGVWIIGFIAVAAIAGTLHEQDNKAQQTEAQNTEDTKAQQDLQKQKADYRQCLTNADDLYTDSLGKLPSNQSSTDRLQSIQLLQNQIESFKKDCDRFYGKN